MVSKRPSDRARSANGPSPRKRLTGDERERRILDAAAAFFAEHGFDGSTRQLAGRLGITQALLYRYFPSKRDLIDRVFATSFADRWDPAWQALLADRTRDLGDRLIDFYQEYLARSTAVSMRLWMHANLAKLNFAGRFSALLTAQVLKPVVGELRHLAKLPSFDDTPLMRGERELAMMLHGSMVFISIRRNIYRMPMPEDLRDIVALQVRSFLPGALKEIRRLHGKSVDPRLTVQVLSPARRRRHD